MPLPSTMRLVQVHKPISMNKHDFQSLMTCNLIGKTPGAVILMLQNASKWFSGPNILNFLNHFCSNLHKEAQGNFLRLSKMLVARPPANGF